MIQIISMSIQKEMFGILSLGKAGEQSSPWEGEEGGQFGGRIGRIKERVIHPKEPP